MLKLRMLAIVVVALGAPLTITSNGVESNSACGQGEDSGEGCCKNDIDICYLPGNTIVGCYHYTTSTGGSCTPSKRC
jgi:hypothetical protein